MISLCNSACPASTVVADMAALKGRLQVSAHSQITPEPDRSTVGRIAISTKTW
ncbi:MAG: hypothetical protein AB9834_19445 [Lentimicrobium sp.]